MTWKTAYRSFYYEGAPEPEDLVLDRATTALLVIDIQNKYMAVPSSTAEQKRWAPFFDRMNNIVIPNTRALIDLFRESWRRALVRPDRLSQGGRSGPLAEPKKTRVELSAHAENQRGIAVRSQPRPSR